MHPESKNKELHIQITLLKNLTGFDDDDDDDENEQYDMFSYFVFLEKEMVKN